MPVFSALVTGPAVAPSPLVGLLRYRLLRLKTSGEMAMVTAIAGQYL